MERKKPQQRDLRKHFEAILGREIADIEEGTLALRERRAVWLQDFENGHLTSRDIGTTGDSTKACGAFPIFFIGGITPTGANGKVDFLLSEYHCLPQVAENALNPTTPIIFVATAQTQEPVFVTSRTIEVFSSDSNLMLDVRIELYTWGPGGSPATGKLVKWFCMFPFTSPVVV